VVAERSDGVQANSQQKIERNNQPEVAVVAVAFVMALLANGQQKKLANSQ